MIDHRMTHRCLLAEIASGEDLQSGKPSQTLQTLLLIGFVTRQPNPHRTFYHLALTEAGHRYLAGLWH
jgi:DNA-binding MarR family transcriptional regulator